MFDGFTPVSLILFVIAVIAVAGGLLSSRKG